MDAAQRVELKRAVDQARRDELRRNGDLYACAFHDRFTPSCVGCGQRRRRLLRLEQRA